MVCGSMRVSTIHARPINGFPIALRRSGKIWKQFLTFLQRVQRRGSRRIIRRLAVAGHGLAGCRNTVQNGGLGFDFKWNMGWMRLRSVHVSSIRCTDASISTDRASPVYYGTAGDFCSPQCARRGVSFMGKSHSWPRCGRRLAKFANLRLLFRYMFSHPGKTALFMGDEFGQWTEWNHHQRFVAPVGSQDPYATAFIAACSSWCPISNRYTATVTLHVLDADWSGFQWIGRGLETALAAAPA